MMNISFINNILNYFEAPPNFLPVPLFIFLFFPFRLSLPLLRKSTPSIFEFLFPPNLAVNHLGGSSQALPPRAGHTLV